MIDLKDITLGEIITFKNGKKRPSDEGDIPVYGGNGILGYTNINNYENCIAIGRVGAYCGSVYYEPKQCWISDNAICAIPKDGLHIYYALYLLKSLHLNHRHIGTSQPLLTQEILNKIECRIPEFTIQEKIANILQIIDSKIENNNQINRNLSEQALAIYHKMFIETDNDERTTCRTDEFFDITIGKTPPRKEKEWFSDNPEDCVWISISDMGSCGTFITDSSEYLTKAAVDKHNVKVVPDNTVILSFKLTVGRIAITVGETTTNEAIAHFNTSKDNITEYLYCYLKSFDFGSLGSTSSIGTAVNSKTIKAMDFVIPEESELQEFCDIARPMFEQIKKNQFENQNLISMRDSLLPKLMSGELDVSDLDI